LKEEFLKYFNESLAGNTFVKLTLGKYRGEEAGLENVYAEPVKIGDDILLSFRFKYKTRDIYKNHTFDSASIHLEEHLGKDFLYGALYTIKNDIIIEFNKKREARLYRKKPTFSKVEVKSHNKVKSRFINSKEKFLNLLGITNKTGEVHALSYDKFRQIDKFIEVVDSLFRESALSNREKIHVTDFGSGKSYLTFALYHYFKNKIGVDISITGIEQREDLVEFSNKAAENCGFVNLKFINNNILEYNCKYSDLVVALHACDTATDDAISKAINAKAEIIVLAPCCQKYVRKQITIPENVKSIFKHGIIEENISSYVTDGLRALMLEAHGYKTKVFEFISYGHTAKNIIITAVKSDSKSVPAANKLDEIGKIKSEFGLRDFYLDKILEP
jgi:hypothetical protein